MEVNARHLQKMNILEDAETCLQDGEEKNARRRIEKYVKRLARH